MDPITLIAAGVALYVIIQLNNTDATVLGNSFNSLTNGLSQSLQNIANALNKGLGGGGGKGALPTLGDGGDGDDDDGDDPSDGPGLVPGELTDLTPDTLNAGLDPVQDLDIPDDSDSGDDGGDGGD